MMVMKKYPAAQIGKRFLAFLVSAVILLCGCMASVSAEDYTVEYVGASISFAVPRSLRFKFQISKSAVASAKEYGALIASAYDLNGERLVIGNTTYTYSRAVAYKDGQNINAVFSENNNAVQYAISLTGIAQEDYDKLFSVRPYVILQSGTVVFGQTITKSVYDVAVQAAQDTENEYSVSNRGDFCRIAEEYTTDANGNPVDLLAGNAQAAAVQGQTNARIAEIRSAESDYTASGTVYYVSADGSDSNSGTSEAAPWKSLAKVNAASLSAGDVVLLKRGDLFRGQLVMTDGVTYSAYGQGEKPRLYGSPVNAADESKWAKLDGSDSVWMYQDELPDVGMVVFNDGEAYAVKEAPCYQDNGFVDADGNAFDVITALDQNYEFFCDCQNVLGSNGVPDTANSTGRLYLHCEDGNPGTVFESIEFGCYGDIITGTGTKNVTIDNLCVKYGGSHAIGTGNATNFTVRNCEIGWIGGSILRYNSDTGKPARYGNGVQVHSACNGYTVSDNYIYQIFDAGITHQQADLLGTNCEFKNISYTNNVIEKCAWSVEYYMNTANTGYTHTMSNVEISHNIMRLAGSGFGNSRDDTWHYPAHIMSWWNESSSSNAANGATFTVSDNIFDRSTKSLIEIHAKETGSLPVLSGNTYLQTPNGNLGRYGLSESNYNANQIVCNNLAYGMVNSVTQDAAAKVYFTDYVDEIRESIVNQAEYFEANPVAETYGFTVDLTSGKTVRYLKVLQNGLRLTDVTIPSLTGASNGEPVSIIQFSDTHLIGENDEEDAQKANLAALYAARVRSFAPTRSVRVTTNSLNFGKLFDRMVVTGDLFDYYSNGCKALSQQVFNSSYTNLLTLLGNHESSETIGSITGGLEFETLDTKVIYEDLNSSIYGYGEIQTEGSPTTLAEAAAYNDIYLAQNLVCDDNGNEKALLLMMDNSWDKYFRYDENDFHYDLLEFYISYAKANQIPVLIFEHKPISTGWDRDVITTFDIIDNPNGANSNFGKNSTGLAGGRYNTDTLTQRVYDLITNNADVVKGIFCGDYHNNIYSEISAKTSDGVATVIPQYTVSGNYTYSNCIRITVE